MTKPETFTKFGKFVIGSGKELFGELHVAGKDSLLYLRDDESFDPHVTIDGCITGVLHDLTRVTLLKCINLTGIGCGSRNDEIYYDAKIFPHFILEGERHLAADDRIISKVAFKLEDGTNLFYDFDAFGSVIDARPYIEQIATANGLDRPIPIGPNRRSYTSLENAKLLRLIPALVASVHNITQVGACLIHAASALITLFQLVLICRKPCASTKQSGESSACLDFWN